MTASESFGPVDPRARIVALDALRGAALWGVLLVNLMTDFRISLFEHLSSFHTERGALDRAADVVMALFFEQKAMVVFSFLFGVGLAIQRDRAVTRDAPPLAFFARRYGILFVIGLVHLLFVWSGDILAQYGLAAIIVAPLIGLRPAWLAALGACFLIFWALPFTPPWVKFPSPETMRDLATDSGRFYGHGSLAEAQAFRFREIETGILPLLISVLPRTIGLFLLGAAAYGANLVREPPRRAAIRVAVLALALGFIGAVADVAVAESLLDLGSWRGSIASGSSIGMGLGYVALWAALPERWMARLVEWLAPLGRMALTSYLLQSVICIALFYGVGLGLMNRIGASAAFAIAGAIFVLQAWTSRLYARRYRFGPIEWIWRRASY